MSNPDTEGQSFPTEFVPVSRILIEEFSYQVAYLWGVIWQYCHMEDGICKASHQTIADRADISRRSVISYLDTLIEAGYIEDLTPDVRNEPHRYCVKKGVQVLHTKEQQRKAEREKSKRPAVQDSPERYAEDAQQNGEGVQELPTESERYAEIAQPGVQNLHKNRPSLIDSTDSPKGGDKSPTQNKSSPSQIMFSALATLCQYDLSLISEKERGMLNQAEKKMRDNGYHPADIESFGKWWYAKDWRGKKKQPPTLGDIRKTWGQFRKYQQNGVAGNDKPNFETRNGQGYSPGEWQDLIKSVA